MSNVRRHTVKRYLSLTEVAERIGVQPRTLSRYRLPEPDAWIGSTRGWRDETIDRWHASRPSQQIRTSVTVDNTG